MAVLRFFILKDKGGKYMSLVLFFAGLWLGGIIGVFTMCLFQISGKCAEKEEAQHCLYSRREGDLE